MLPLNPGLGLIFVILVRHANDTFLGAAVFSDSEDFGEKLAGNVTWKLFFSVWTSPIISVEYCLYSS